MLSPEVLVGIASKVVDNETLERIAKEAFEAHREVLASSGVPTASWDSVGFIVQNAWRWAIVSAGENFIDICNDVYNAVCVAETEAHKGF